MSDTPDMKTLRTGGFDDAHLGVSEGDDAKPLQAGETGRVVMEKMIAWAEPSPPMQRRLDQFDLEERARILRTHPTDLQHRVLLGNVKDYPAPGCARYKGDITADVDTMKFPQTSFGTGLEVESASYDPDTDRTTVVFKYTGVAL